MQEMALNSSDLVEQSAQAICSAFELFQKEFKEITCRAQQRFEKGNWHGMQKDMVERLDLYTQVIKVTVAEMHNLLKEEVKDKTIWAVMKASYSRCIAQKPDMELAETFFNSVTRRIFTTVGVDPSIEFVDSDFDPPPPSPDMPIFHSYFHTGSTFDLVRLFLQDLPFEVEYADLDLDARLAAKVIDEHILSTWGSLDWDRVDIVKAISYRSVGAYVIGRIYRGELVNPIVLSLRHPPAGIRLDAVLLTEDDVSILFSFTRSYFLVDTDKPHELIHFLKTIMPRKRVAELYISIGYNKHGKTELYRELLEHLKNTCAVFDIAPGEKGMVMIVFTMPDDDIVFKVIRDRSAEPKTLSRQDVMAHYRLVFLHDRAGRLVDAQEYEHLTFDKARFSERLLAELLAEAPSCVAVDGNRVDIKHLYLERRVIPLNLYLQQAELPAARAAAIDYGYAIKDMASTNVFPGDILLKNFGVTRHGRVVFYDYDELCELEICKFRRIPQPRNDDEDMSSEPWFYVGKYDIFPQEFNTFLGLTGELREAFLSTHADIFDVEFWQNIQALHQAGFVVDIFPYRQDLRLHENSLA